ncbi:hypothetical protein QAD02_006530 [Eretmocerus hayati]|uniref:Uncharacterized protein n=1 Tax=Eretmocerus hayati TaxID=131215 RepID=A0ACC2N178_9HYME|nr:hypothetical protein QAD02_006530 [Eretmocerus hayati]
MIFQLCFFLILSLFSWEIESYGRVWEPVHRGSAWRKGFPTPINYEDNMNQCGGFVTLHYKNGGRCGICGDDFASSTPRDNENKGKYGTGTIVQKYQANQTIDVEVELTANLDSNVIGMLNFKVNLPKKLTCEQCVFRWQYTAANNWGICPDGTGALGCGPQETFRTCSDVQIVKK